MSDKKEEEIDNRYHTLWIAMVLLTVFMCFKTCSTTEVEVNILKSKSLNDCYKSMDKRSCVKLIETF